jgi:hypothetical protein
MLDYKSWCGKFVAEGLQESLGVMWSVEGGFLRQKNLNIWDV